MIAAKMYSVRDAKAEVFNTPFFMSNDAVAVRQFKDMAVNPDTMICKHPEDYSLYCVGSFDFLSGAVDVVEPLLVISGLQVEVIKEV